MNRLTFIKSLGLLLLFKGSQLNLASRQSNPVIFSFYEEIIKSYKAKSKKRLPRTRLTSIIQIRELMTSKQLKWIQDQIEEDFHKNETFAFQNWVLSITEVEIYIILFDQSIESKKMHL